MSDQRPEWITRAAEEIEPNDSPVEFERELGCERIERIADIIARHAPAEPTAIGPGDVVQTERGDLYIVNGLNKYGGAHVGQNFGGTTLPLTYLARIGRAKYWPDGSLVEGGGE